LSDGHPGSGTPPRSTIAQGAWFGLVMGVGIVAGRIASDAVRESLGWWGSVGVGMLVAIVAALIMVLIVSAWQRRRRTGPGPRP
jgi:hypothetical protein